VRGALTTELWETTNQTWLEFSRMLMSGVLERDPSAVFEWVKFRSHLCRGVAVGTMLQDEALCFIRIGTFLERSDNTARLLDVKFHGSGHEMAAPKWANKGAPAKDAHTETDFYYWSALLRSLSAFEIYRRVYSSVILPEKVAELLILRPDMPRSLAACMHEVVNNLNLVANSQSQETCRKVGRLSSDLQFTQIDEILDGGLHAFLTQFLSRINDIGARISKDFLVAA
jgi:uncharacterized alpha-E superfamily protein